MPFVPVPNTVEVEVVYELFGQVVENTLFYEFTTTPSETDIAALLDAVKSVMVDQVLPLLSVAIKLVRLVGTLLDAVDSLQVISVLSTPAAGGVSGGVVPNNTAYCLSLKTASRGRSARGRNYIAAIPQSSLLTANTVTSGLRTGLVDAYGSLIGVGADLGAAWVIVSRFTGGSPRTTGVTTPVTAVDTFDDVLDSQRRRQLGRGV